MVTLLELITEDLGQPQKVKGDSSWWLCPFHDDHDPSLQVSEFRGRYYYKCWSCGQEGKAWEWLEQYRHMGRRDIHVMLYGQGQDSPSQPAAAPSRPQRKPSVWTDPPDKTWQDVALDACLEAAADLHSPQYAWVLSYLTKQRGLTPETIQKARLGYNPDWKTLPVGALPPGIVIPCWTDHDLWYVKVRLTKEQRDKTGQKYMALKGSQTASLYNAESLKTAAVGVVCEGEFDAMLLQQEVPDVAVVTMGSATAGLSDHWRSYFAGLDRLLVMLDEDQAGQAGLAKWQTAVNWCQVLRPPDLPGKDVTDWHGQGLDLWQWVSGQLVSQTDPVSKP